MFVQENFSYLFSFNQIEKNFLYISFRCHITLLQEAVILMVGENKYLKGKFISFETKYLKSVENHID